MKPYYREAIADIIAGVESYHLWGRIGWAEVRRRYRRTVIGPFWSSLSLAIFVVGMGVVWVTVWGLDPKKYLPFLNSGMLAWVLFTAFMNEGCVVFTSAESLIKQFPVNFTTLICILIWRNLLVFFHNLLVYIPVYLYAGLSPSANSLWIIPGLILLCFNGMWISLLLGLICVRYRDVQQVVSSFLQVSVFITPIFWSPDQIKGRATVFVDYNPLYHYIAIIREPLMGNAPTAWTWTCVLGATVIGWVLAIALFARFRRRVAYWL